MGRGRVGRKLLPLTLAVPIKCEPWYRHWTWTYQGSQEEGHLWSNTNEHTHATSYLKVRTDNGAPYSHHMRT
jgi:hypothetical protein